MGAHGQRLVNSHASAPGQQRLEERDAATGTLTSRPFALERDYITFLIGGGNHPGKTCVNLIVSEDVVLSATGADNNRLHPMSWDVRRWAGKTAKLVIVDNETRPWGNIGVDNIVLSDQPHVAPGPLAAKSRISGSMCSGACSTADPGRHRKCVAVRTNNLPGREIFSAGGDRPPNRPPSRSEKKLIGSLGRKFTLPPNGSVKIIRLCADVAFSEFEIGSPAAGSVLRRPDSTRPKRWPKYMAKKNFDRLISARRPVARHLMRNSTLPLLVSGPGRF